MSEARKLTAVLMVLATMGCTKGSLTEPKLDCVLADTVMMGPYTGYIYICSTVGK
jgi:hypothetical protein